VRAGVCVLAICVVVHIVFCIACTVLFVLYILYKHILICFVCTGVKTASTDWEPNCSKVNWGKCKFGASGTYA
jgi:hypothetical protein